MPAAALQLVPQGAAPSWRVLQSEGSRGAEATGTPGVGGWSGVSVDTPAPGVSLIPSPRDTATPTTTAAISGATALTPARAVDPSLLPADADLMAAAPLRRPYLLSPSLGGGVPSGYVGGWGDYFIAGSAGTAGKLREGSPDGSVNMGIGFGDPVNSLGFELNWGIGSTKNFNANGSVGVSVGRILVNRPDLQIALGGGLLDAYSYGTEAGPTPVNGYGALTVALPLQPGNPSFPRRLQLTVGAGGSSFAAIDANFQTTDSGLFAAVGVDVLPNLGLSVGQSSRSTNLNLSWIPFRSLPVFVNVVAADVFDVTPWGTIGVLSIGWGDSLKRGFFSQ